MSTLVPLICSYCHKNYYLELRHYNYYRKHRKNQTHNYCSLKCYLESKPKHVECECANCHKSFMKRPCEMKRSITGNYYCSQSCAASNNNRLFKTQENNANYIYGKGTYRIRAIKHYGFCCASKEKCPLKNIQLPNFLYEVDHIDGNRKNNKIENLQILCCWCHKKKTLHLDLV